MAPCGDPIWSCRIRTVGVIDELARRGIAALAATSRRARVVRPYFEKAGLSLPAVLLDGAVGVDFRSGARFHEAVFSQQGASAALASFRSLNSDGVGRRRRRQRPSRCWPKRG